VADIDRLPKTTISVKEKDGREHVFSGVALNVLLKDAGATLGDELRGKNLTKYMLVEARDGYKIVYALAEIDPAFTDRKIILANRKDGALLTAGEGPFRMIVEGEKRAARNARQVTVIKIQSAVE